MPKEEIDYSNTIIYKIYCNDQSINEIYVGHTTNFTKRKYQHKLCCSNLNNNFKIYSTIREHGGWDNWNMVEIAKYNCKDKTEARIKEQEHYSELNSSLNSCPPYVDKKKYFCSTCNINCTTKNVYETHINCSLYNKNIKLNNELIKKTQKNASYFCDFCQYKTDNKTDYSRHILTPKHSNNKFLINNNNNNTEKTPSIVIFKCSCGKEYKYQSGLCAHKKKCNIEKIEVNNNYETLNITPELILDIIQQNQEFKELLIKQNKENQELQKQILEVCKNTSTNNTNNTNINSHNKTFNLQFFLNEECKDALNISEFVSSIKVQLEDLETTGRLGYVEGVSRIINKNLNELDQTKRPIHCSDVKREVLYIKNDDQWVKENETKPLLTKAIKQIANENIKQISEWRKKYPDCTDSESRKNDLYLNIVSNAMSGCTAEEQTTNYEKIITKVAREVVIEK
jgi:hypothetical protein